MIKLFFVRGSTVRQVYIDSRKISFLSPEVGYKPIVMDLDKINEKDFRDKLSTEELELMQEVANLKTEEEMALDLKKDFQRTGWRLFKKE